LGKTRFHRSCNSSSFEGIPSINISAFLKQVSFFLVYSLCMFTQSCFQWVWWVFAWFKLWLSNAMAEVNSQSRTWEMRLLNYSEADVQRLNDLDCNAIIVAAETCPTTGTPHLQGRITFKRKYTTKQLVKNWPSIHWEKTKCSADTNYFRKTDSTLLIEKGGFGKAVRNDLEQVKKKLKTTNSMGSIVEEVNNYNTIRMCESILKYKEPQRPVGPVNVIWFWGDTGCGKTRAVYTDHVAGDIFLPVSYKWWEGYDGHKVVLLDDFRKDFCKYHELLKLLDIYPYRVETKGGSRQIQAHTFYITSCFSPAETYETREDLQQLLRRVTEEWKFTKLGRVPINEGARKAAEAVAGTPSPMDELVD